MARLSDRHSNNTFSPSLTRTLGTLLLFWAVSFSAAAAESGCTQLTATGNAEYPPYLWRDADTGALVGANQLILDEVASRLGVTIDLVDSGSWARAQEQVRSNNVDIIAGAFFTEPRTEYMSYLYPAFLTTSSVVWKQKSAELTYTAPEDLKGRSITTVTNNSFGQAFDEFAKDELSLEYVSSLEQALRMVASGRAEFALYEKNPGIAYAEQLNLMQDLAVLDPPISREGLYFTLGKGSGCNTPQFQEKFEEILENLVFEEFMQRALSDAQDLWRSQTD